MHFRAALASLAMAGLASATIAPNSPIDSTVCIGGNVCTVSWVEDNQQPLISTFGAVEVGLFVGSVNEQTQVQDFGQVDDPTTTMSMNYNIDANSGPDGSFYFVRFQSVGATDDNGTPLQAFSSMFTLASMTGQLSAEAQAQVDGTSMSSSVTGATTSSAVAASSTTAPAESTSRSRSSKSASAADEDVASASGSSKSGSHSESSESMGDNPFVSGASAVKFSFSIAAAAVAGLSVAL